jgi:hypothetical protein
MLSPERAVVAWRPRGWGPYTNVKCVVARARASYLESNYGEQARARSNRLRTYQLMSCTTESGYSYAHQSYLQAITNVQLTQSSSRFRCVEVECGRHVKPETVPAYSYGKENGSLEMKKHSWEAKKEDRFDPLLCHSQSVDAWHHMSDLGQMLQTRRSWIHVVLSTTWLESCPVLAKTIKWHTVTYRTRHPRFKGVNRLKNS